ncbi:SseB family protein [Streptomyces roseifaciens]|uniref:SseB family protein n=1 Tax=Streptomyces roseifaciens TaxID=1488406 RepID=UPI001365341F
MEGRRAQGAVRRTPAQSPLPWRRCSSPPPARAPTPQCEPPCGRTWSSRPGRRAGNRVVRRRPGTFVPVFTSAEQAPASAPTLQRRPCRTLLEHLPPEVLVALNPGGTVSVRLPVADLLTGDGD